MKQRGSVSTDEIIKLAIALLMTVIILPIALNEIGGMNNENWGDNASTLLVIIGTVVPLVAVLGLGMKFIGR